MHCPLCRDGKLVEIQLRVAEKHLVMRSCSHCETRWWDGDGEPLGLDGVLDLASVGRR